MDGIKRLYRVVRGLALLHLIGLVGGMGYLAWNGRLDVEKVREIVKLLSFAEGGEEEIEEPGGESAEESASGSGDQAAGRDLVGEEIGRREAARYRTELEQRLKFVNAARVDLTREREEFKRQQDEKRVQREEQIQKAALPGYRKELEIIEALSPKTALGQLMTMTDAEAARIVFNLDTRKVKKLFEAARSEEQRRKMASIRKMLRDMRGDSGDSSSEGTRN